MGNIVRACRSGLMGSSRWVVWKAQRLRVGPLTQISSVALAVCAGRLYRPLASAAVDIVATTAAVVGQMIQSLRDLRVEPAARGTRPQSSAARALVGLAPVPAVVSPVSPVVTSVFSPI